MSLTPKHWDTFQHYKKRSPPWIRLYRSLLDDYEFACLPDASRALAPCIWLLASEYPNGEITASRAAIAFRLHISENKLEIALMPLIDGGFVIDASTMLARCYQDAIPETETEKSTEIDFKEKSISRALSRTGCDEVFEQFWKEYPKREGANPKAPARKAFLAAVKAGTDPQAIIAGASNYAAAPSTKIATPYVAQAVTWLHQHRWEDYAVRVNGGEEDEARRKEREAHDAELQAYWRAENAKEI